MSQNLNELLPILSNVINGLAKHFGASNEFVVHSYVDGEKHTICAIANGEVTGRHVGDDLNPVMRKTYPGEQEADENTCGVFNYQAQMNDGRMLKCSTILLKDEEGKTIGSVCINSDITQIFQAKSYIESFYGISDTTVQSNVMIDGSVNDVLIAMIEDSVRQIGVPTSVMTKSQKMQGIACLYNKGAFKIQRACDIIARYYDISKYTVYNYLEEIKTQQDG